MKVVERCACGGSVEASGEGMGLRGFIDRWRDDHPCDRRPPHSHEHGDALVEQPHPPVGFTVPA